MSASDLFHAGRLKDAIDAQIAKVKASPADNPARFFLFDLFLFAGDLDRARKQLEVIRYDVPERSAAVEQYRQALEAETKRRAVFAGTQEPKGLESAPDHIKLRFQALPHLARKEWAEARRLLDEANAAVPTLKGTFNGKPIEGCFDADERFGTILEVIANGGVYSWVPLERIAEITMNPPRSPRDVVFRPAHLVLADGLEGDVLLPGLYPNSHEHHDDLVKLGRSTEWVGEDSEVTRGAGGRVLLVGDAFVPFGDIKQLTQDAPAES